MINRCFFHGMHYLVKRAELLLLIAFDEKTVLTNDFGL
jgi:hypothetical protein